MAEVSFAVWKRLKNKLYFQADGFSSPGGALFRLNPDIKNRKA